MLHIFTHTDTHTMLHILYDIRHYTIFFCTHSLPLSHRHTLSIHAHTPTLTSTRANTPAHTNTGVHPTLSLARAWHFWTTNTHTQLQYNI